MISTDCDVCIDIVICSESREQEEERLDRWRNDGQRQAAGQITCV